MSTERPAQTIIDHFMAILQGSMRREWETRFQAAHAEYSLTALGMSVIRRDNAFQIVLGSPLERFHPLILERRITESFAKQVGKIIVENLHGEVSRSTMLTVYGADFPNGAIMRCGACAKVRSAIGEVF